MKSKIENYIISNKIRIDYFVNNLSNKELQKKYKCSESKIYSIIKNKSYIVKDIKSFDCFETKCGMEFVNNILTYKICSKCNNKLNINNFKKQKNKYCCWCFDCVKKYKKEYSTINKKKINQQKKEYYSKNVNIIKPKKELQRKNNKENKKEYDKKRYNEKKNQIEFIEKRKQYYKENKEKSINRNKKNSNKRYKNDPKFKIKNRISVSIGKAINKNNNSILKYLPYTIDQLKTHLENQFEPWMSWSNWKKYNSKTWDDNDNSTWTWNIDHIIPHSKFKYTTIEDEEFKICWSLDNLRPYSAKLNVIEGNRR